MPHTWELPTPPKEMAAVKEPSLSFSADTPSPHFLVQPLSTGFIITHILPYPLFPSSKWPTSPVWILSLS